MVSLDERVGFSMPWFLMYLKATMYASKKSHSCQISEKGKGEGERERAARLDLRFGNADADARVEIQSESHRKCGAHTACDGRG